MATWPSELAGFESFLSQQGLARTRREESSSFDNKLVEYSDGTLSVRVVCDRGVWHVEVSDIANLPGEWYDAALVRDLLGGRGMDVLPLSAQIAIVETDWHAIRSRLAPTRRQASHARLAELRKERANRRFPGLRHPGSAP